MNFTLVFQSQTPSHKVSANDLDQTDGKKAENTQLISQQILTQTQTVSSRLNSDGHLELLSTGSSHSFGAQAEAINQTNLKNKDDFSAFVTDAIYYHFY